MDTTHLLHLCGRALEQLDVSLPQDLLMLLQGALSVLLAGEQDEGVPGGAAVRVAHKQDAVASPTHVTRLGGPLPLAEEGQHLLVRRGEGEPPHPHDDLVLSGQEHGHLVGST